MFCEHVGSVSNEYTTFTMHSVPRLRMFVLATRHARDPESILSGRSYQVAHSDREPINVSIQSMNESAYPS